jgi:hypothetical protein
MKSKLLFGLIHSQTMLRPMWSTADSKETFTILSVLDSEKNLWSLNVQSAAFATINYGIQKWNTTNGSKCFNISTSNRIFSIAMDKMGYLWSLSAPSNQQNGSNTLIEKWNTKTGSKLFEFSSPSIGRSCGLVIQNDFIYTCSSFTDTVLINGTWAPSNYGTIDKWDTQTGALVLTLAKANVTFLALAADNDDNIDSRFIMYLELTSVLLQTAWYNSISHQIIQPLLFITN